MTFHRFKDGTAIRGNRSPDLHDFQGLESWNPQKVEKEKKPYISIGCFEHRTFIQKHSLGKSAQFIRSSLKLEWTARSKSERDCAYLGKVHDKKDSVNP